MHITEWQGCYEDSWDDLIVKEAFAHPAKYSYGLITRIIKTGIERGYWQPGDLVADPFGGIATGGIIAGYHGLNWVGVELEPRFVQLGNKNLAMHNSRFVLCGATCVKLLQGDSRNFAEIVGSIEGIVTSPPYAESFSGKQEGHKETAESMRRRGCSEDAIAKACTPGSHTGGLGYGTTTGNIGNLKSGSVDAVITSPPYAECVKGDHGETETAKESRDKRTTPGGSLGQSARHGGYGATAGQIGALKEGAIDGIVTSPPFEQNGANLGAVGETASLRQQIHNSKKRVKAYGQTAGQLGNTSGETYWQAMKIVYEQCRLALKPGGIMAVVVKDYIKKKQRVTLCDSTVTLLESLGFEVFERVHAMLVKEERHPSLFGGEEVKKTERKSFFRRLTEKRGSPSLDYEEVLLATARR